MRHGHLQHKIAGGALAHVALAVGDAQEGLMRGRVRHVRHSRHVEDAQEGLPFVVRQLEGLKHARHVRLRTRFMGLERELGCAEGWREERGTASAPWGPVAERGF